MRKSATWKRFCLGFCFCDRTFTCINSSHREWMTFSLKFIVNFSEMQISRNGLITDKFLYMSDIQNRPISCSWHLSNTGKLPKLNLLVKSLPSTKPKLRPSAESTTIKKQINSPTSKSPILSSCCKSFEETN